MTVEKRLEGTEKCAQCAVIGLFGGRSGCGGRCEWDFVQWEAVEDSPKCPKSAPLRGTKTAETAGRVR